MDSQDNLQIIHERLVKTDEVIRLLDVKKKEANKLDKSYKKLIEKFCAKHTEVVNLKNECQKLNKRLTNSTEIHLPCQKEIKELKTQNERLEQNHNDYVNAAEKKYQSACQEIVTLNEACDSLNKKIEKIEQKESKAKNVKKIQEALHKAKEQLKDSILRYDELESTSNETISNLEKKFKILEERQNETLKQLAKANLDCDKFKKSQDTPKISPNKSKLQQKIEKLETKLQSFEIEQGVLNQSHENDIAELKKQHEKEKKLLEVQLQELQQKVSEETDIIKEKRIFDNNIIELNKKHEIEKKLLEDQIEKLKSKISKVVNTHENDNKYLNEKLEEFRNQINEANKKTETTGTQTDYEDIYNLEDILTEMHSLPTLMSPLISESSLKQDIEDVIATCSIAVGTDDILPTFIDSSSQTKVRSFNLCTKVFNNLDIQAEKSSCSVGTETDDFIKLIDSCTQTIEVADAVNPKELFNKTDTSVEKLKCSTDEIIAIENGTDLSTHAVKNIVCVNKTPVDDTRPTLTDSSTQTCDPVNVNQSKIKVRSFDFCTEVFNVTDTQVENSKEMDNSVSLTDSSTQTKNSIDILENEIEFKSFEPLEATLPKNNILVEIPKIVKLKSRVTKKYKNNNKNRVLNTLRNSKLNLKCLLEKYINTNSKFVIVSSSILKTDYNKTKIPDIDQKTERCNNSCYSNCSNTLRQDHFCSCSCPQNMFYNRYFGQCPVYQIPYDFNHGMYYRANNSTNYYDIRQKIKAKYKNIDDTLNSSDSEEEDINLRQVLKEYKQSIIKKYLTDKYLAKIAKKNLRPVNLENNKSNLFVNNKEKNKTNLLLKGKLKNKLSKFNRIIYSSDSEEEIPNKNKTNKISKCTESNTITKNMEDDSERKCNLAIDKNNSIPKEKNQIETVSKHKETNNSSENTEFITTSIESNYEEEIPDDVGRSTEKNTSKESEENISSTTEDNINTIVDKSVGIRTNVETNPQTHKLPFILSKKQQSLLRKGRSVKNGANLTKKVVTPNRIYATRSKINCNPRKRKSSFSSEVEFKKQKEALFGSESDSDTSIADKSETSRKASDTINSTDCNRTVKNLKQNETTLKSPKRSSVSDDNTNKEKTLDIMSDYSYPSIRQTRSRIALKRPENIDTNRSISPDTNDQKGSSSNKMETPVNKKLFKRPGISKMNTPAIKNNKPPKECQIILQDINKDLVKDSPDSPDIEPIDIFTYNKMERPSTYVMKKAKKSQKDSQILVIDSPASSGHTEEPVDFVLYNKLERPSTYSIQNENEVSEIDRIQPIDIDEAQRLIKVATTMDWNKGFMANVVSYLTDKDPTTVARLIVNISAQDFSQEFDKTFTPPAPLLTTTQQKIIVLLSQLEKNNLPDIHNIFLQEVEKRLLSETRVEVVHPLTRLFVAVCKLKYEIEKVRMLCCHAAYFMGELILPLMFIVLTTWGDILPMADSSEDIPLAVALVHVIHLKTCQQPGYNFMTLNRLLSDYYGYKRGEKSNEDIMKQLIRSYSDNYSKTAYTAILILCKNLPHKWTYSQIKTNLLPLLENCNNYENKSLTVSLIQRIVSQFKMKTDEEYIIDIKNCLSKFVINPGVVPPVGFNN